MLSSLVSMTMSLCSRSAATRARSARDAVEQRSVALQRVRAPHRLEAAHEGRVGGVEKQHTGVVGAPQRLEFLLHIGEQTTAADVDDRCNPRNRVAGVP